MPEFRLISKNFIELSELEEKIRFVAQKRNNEVMRNDHGYGVEFEILNPQTNRSISFSIYDRDEFIDSFKFHNNEYGNIIQIDWSSKISHDDIDYFMIPFIKEFGNNFPNILVEQGNNKYCTIEEYVKINEE